MDAEGSISKWVRTAEGVFFYPQAVLFVLCLAQVSFCCFLLRRRSYSSIDAKIGALLSVGTEEWQRILGPVGCPLGQCLLYVSQSSTTLQQGKARLQKFFSEAEVAAERTLRMLGVFAQVAMLFGLLGTVVGLVMSFSVISQYKIAPPPSELAFGVSRALATTICGLSTAIPAFLAHAWLQGHADSVLLRLSVDLESFAGVLTENEKAENTEPSAEAGCQQSADGSAATEVPAEKAEAGVAEK